MMSARAKGALMEWTPISKRVITHDSTQSTKETDGDTSIYSKKTMRWMSREMDSTTSCSTLFQTSIETT